MKKVQGMCWKHIHCLILMSRLSHSCLVLNLFTPDEEKKKKTSSLHTPHPLNGNGKWYWLQWKPTIEPYGTANLNVFSIPLQQSRQWKPAVHYQTGSCFFVNHCHSLGEMCTFYPAAVMLLSPCKREHVKERARLGEEEYIFLWGLV